MDNEQLTNLLYTHTNKFSNNKEIVTYINHNVPNPLLKYKSIKQKIWHIIHDMPIIPICPVCELKPLKWNKGGYNTEYTDTCGKKCANKMTSNDPKVRKKTRETNVKKYGGNAPASNNTIRNKIHNTNVERYGDDYKTVNSEKSKKSIQQKYKVSNCSQLEWVKQKKQETSIINYGVSHPMKSDEIQNKCKNTLFDDVNRYHPNQTHISPETIRTLSDKKNLILLHVTQSKSIKDIANELNISIYAIYYWLNKYGIENQHNTSSTNPFGSVGQSELNSFINDNGIPTKNNVNNIIYPQELDIYIPSHNLAIEYNGLYWHSEQAGKSSRYHLNKTIQCEKKGIRLIHIFEDEWKEQKQKCKDTLLHFFNKSAPGDYARNVTIKEIPWNQAKEFLHMYHLLGPGTSGNYRIGAFNSKKELIGVMIFGRQNNEKSDKHNIELKRFVTNKKNNPGLGSKMFKYAITSQKYDKVIAFVDRRWFTGLVKDYIGFKPVYNTSPAIWWTNGKNRKTRRFVTKQQLVQSGADSQLSKQQILSDNGYFRIWDCGKIKLEWYKS